jgi:IS5 family transposase
MALKRISFSSAEFAAKMLVTRLEQFLADMDRVVPWVEFKAVIALNYSTGICGRLLIGLPRMLRVYFSQQWYRLPDERVKDAIFDSQAVRAFVGMDFACELVSGKTTSPKFSRLLEANELTDRMLISTEVALTAKCLLMRLGTIMVAKIINAQTSTKSAEHRCNADMYQVKKGNYLPYGSKIYWELVWKPAKTLESGIRKTATLYFANQECVVNVQSGRYWEGVENNYAEHVA